MAKALSLVPFYVVCCRPLMVLKRFIHFSFEFCLRCCVGVCISRPLAICRVSSLFREFFSTRDLGPTYLSLCVLFRLAMTVRLWARPQSAPRYVCVFVLCMCICVVSVLSRAAGSIVRSSIGVVGAGGRHHQEFPNEERNYTGLLQYNCRTFSTPLLLIYCGAKPLPLPSSSPSSSSSLSLTWGDMRDTINGPLLSRQQPQQEAGDALPMLLLWR